MKIRIFCASAALLLACASPVQALAADAAPTAQTAAVAAGESTAKTAAADTRPAAEKTTEENQTEPAYYPVDVQMSSDGLTCKKIYDVPKTVSPDQIPQEEFDRGGLHYVLEDILRIEMPDIDYKMHSETVTVSSTSNNSNDVLALLPKSKSVTTDDGYSGTAYLDVSSISTKVAGTESVSEELSATREYPNMPEMDMTDIPKTIEDNGNTLTFSDIAWTSETEETDNLGTMETTYTAVVTYTGTATSSRTTGYTVTATYAGEVSHRNNDCMRYIAVYSGEPIVIEPEDNTEPPDLTEILPPEPRIEPINQTEDGTPISWVLCAVFGVLMVLFAMRPPACRRMVMQMQAMASQARGKAQQTIKETEMKLREKQKQKQEQDEKLREEQYIFGPLEKIKAAIRNRRQRKAQERMALLAAPQDDDWLDEQSEYADSYEDTETTSNNESAVTDDASGGDVQHVSDDNDEYPGLGD
ncbi:hypothetical protein [Candidatus Agathobaculum pullicola]|uniref:hypothetical protein n=1 Tax=Candidatus Agathobaculum pullicola TaxID=2838426 RepID=UPI003F8FCECA